MNSDWAYHAHIIHVRKKYDYKMLVVKSHNYHNHVAQISKRFILASIKMFMSARTNSHSNSDSHKDDVVCVYKNAADNQPSIEAGS